MPDMQLMALGVRDPIATVPRDRQGPNREDPGRRFYIQAPQVHWHYHAAPQIASTHDGEIWRAIDHLADEAYHFGRISETLHGHFREGIARLEVDVTRVSYRLKECEIGVQRNQQDLLQLESDVAKYVSKPARELERLTTLKLAELEKTADEVNVRYQ